ncbi:MAG: RES domain-containing protein [Luteitalea sp.]|nr:RES domain-containing protein [Luteitalea sp.]
MKLFRQADPRYPFAWETAAQPEGRWHAPGEGPAHYFADTPDAAWAELVRHEEITSPADLQTIRRAMWVVDVDEAPAAPVDLPEAVLTGDPDSWPACQRAAQALRRTGVTRLDVPSAALLPGAATGYIVQNGLHPSAPRDGHVVVLFGRPERMIGWLMADAAHPPAELLGRVRHYSRGSHVHRR